MRGLLPFVYLGVPLFVGTPKGFWLQSLADRVVGNFSKWKGSSLSMACGLALVKSVIYYSSLDSFMYKWPAMLLFRLEKLARNFIWPGDIMMSRSVTVK